MHHSLISIIARRSYETVMKSCHAQSISLHGNAWVSMGEGNEHHRSHEALDKATMEAISQMKTTKERNESQSSRREQEDSVARVEIILTVGFCRL